MSFPPTWPAVAAPQKIAANQVHVWGWRLDSGLDASGQQQSQLALLDAQELARYHRFHFERDRDRFAIAHANLRRILGAYLNQDPQQIAFRANPLGKPELIAPAQGPALHFNLSHSRTIALLAVSTGTEVGIDVEDVRPIEPELAASHFSPAELAALSSLEGEAWLHGFYSCWTRKEAILKAEGVGLHMPLDSFDVSLIPGLPARLLAVRLPATFRHRWTLHNLVTPEGSAAALAAGSDVEVLCFQFSDSAVPAHSRLADAEIE